MYLPNDQVTSNYRTLTLNCDIGYGVAVKIQWTF